MLVLQEVVQDVDGRLAGEEHLNNEVGGAAIDGDERARRVGALDQRHQHLQPHMHHIQRRPTIKRISRFLAMQYLYRKINSKCTAPDFMRHIAHEDLLQAKKIHMRDR